MRAITGNKILKTPLSQLPFTQQFLIMQLSNSYLNQICIEVCNSNQHYYKDSSAFFSDMYRTGCRPSELLDLSKWRLIGSDYELTTAKTEAKRFIPSYLLSNSFRQSIFEGYRPYNSLTYDQLTLEFRKVVPVHPIFMGKKIVDTYLFRYNRARQLYESSRNLLEVMAHFGWLSASVASGYIHNPLIFSKDFRP